jgi:hypothetical protein
MEELIMLIFLFSGVIAIVIVVSKHFRKIIEKNFSILGDRLELRYEYSKPGILEMLFKYPSPELKGKLAEEYPIRIYVIVRGSGKSRVYYMAFDIETGISHNNSISLLHEGFIRKMGKFLGVQKDIQINDEDFDNHFIIKSDSSLYAKTLLSDPDLREKLLNDYRLLNNGEIKFNNGILHYEGIKTMYNSAEIDNMEALVYLSLQLIKRLKQVKNMDFDDKKSFF